MSDFFRYFKFESATIFIVSFFLYSGYYLGLQTIISLGWMQYSRYYSVPVRLFVFLLCVFFIIKKINKKISKDFGTIFLIISIFSLHYILMVILNLHDQKYMLEKYEYIVYYLTYSIIFLFFYAFCDVKKNIDIIFKAFVISGFLFSILCLYEYGSFFMSGGGRLNQLSFEGETNYISPLVLSYVSVLNFISAWVYFSLSINKNFKYSVLVSITTFLSIPIFILGASRGAFVALFFCILCILFFSKLKVKLTALFLIPLVISFLYFITKITGNNAFDRFFSMKEDMDSNNESMSRFDMWNTALNNFYKNPVLGGYIDVDGTYVHNIVIEVMMSTGILGVSVFGFCVSYIVIKYLVLMFPTKSYTLLLFFILGLIMQLFSGSIYTASIFFASLGLMISYANSERESK